MKKLAESFMTSLKAQLSSKEFDTAKFITEETFINGEPFSFKGHEYQEYCIRLIEDNPGCSFAIMKCSQIGLSEIIMRWIFAKMAVIPGTSVILSMPSLTMVNEVMKTRMSSIIQESPALDGLIDSNNDSASVKRFHNNSIVYGLAGSDHSKSSLLNRPVALIVVDETDRQSRAVYSGYRSRQTHIRPENRCTVMISTPTVSGTGIHLEVSECGIVHEPWVKCACGHEFLPDFYEDIVIPGYDDSLTLLTKDKLSSIESHKAYLKCPGCGEDVDRGGRSTAWHVTENDKWPKTSIGVKLNPWVAWEFISIPDLVVSSTQMASQVEVLNQLLGKTALLSDSAIDRSNFIFDKQPDQPGINVFGLDMGKTCWWMRGIVKPDTTIRVVETIPVKLHDLEVFLEDKFKQHAFSAGVMDQQPFTDLAYKFVKKYPRLYSCIYTSPHVPQPELFKLKMADKHEQLIRQVNLQKTLGFDLFFGQLKDFVTFETSTMDAIILTHMLSLRRVRDYTKSDDLHYKWIKTSREDHTAHSFIYLMLAAKLAYAGVDSYTSLPVMLKKINPERLKQQGRRR